MDVSAGSGHVFISYARADAAYVARLVAVLRDGSIPVWVDAQIPTGERWDSVLRERIETCAAVVLVMSPAAGESGWVAREVRHARVLGKPILPLRLSGDILFELDAIQVENTAGQNLPSAAFVERVRSVASRRVPLRYAGGLVPEAADCFQLRDLAEAVDSTLGAAGSAMVTGGSARILSGLGGVGKTQLAAAVARRARGNAEVGVLVWITAVDRLSIVTAYARAATALAAAALTDDPYDPVAATVFGQVDLDDGDAASIALLGYLAVAAVPWLIVFDDLARPADLDGLWPPRVPGGRVVVTTRRNDAGLASHGTVVPVDLFTPAQARQYLADRFPTRPDRLDQADELAYDLGYLPLALAQAAAYIADRDLTCAGYRARFADRTRTLSDLAPDTLPDDYTRPVAITLSLAVDAADALPPRGLARPVLVLLSLLDPNAIPAAVIEAVAARGHLGEQHDPPASVDVEQVRDAIAALGRLNLVTNTAGTIRVHGLVQRSVRERTPIPALAGAALAVADALFDSWPDVESDTQLSGLLRSNAAALRDQAGDRLWEPDVHPLLFRVGESLTMAGLAAAAIAYGHGIVSEAADRLGSDDPRTLILRNNLAVAYRSAERTDQAIELFEAALIDYERTLGADHPDAVACRHNLAGAYHTAGYLDRAIPMFEATLADLIRVLGPDHLTTLTARSNLARAYESADDLDRAIPLFEATVADTTRVLGADHPNTLIARGNLAGAYHSAEQVDEAVALFETIVADMTRILGPDHPDTLTSQGNLAHAYYSADDFASAIALFEATIADRTRTLGPDHPSLLTTRNNLALAYHAAGRIEQALTLFEAVAADLSQLLGPDHPDTQLALRNLAMAHESAG